MRVRILSPGVQSPDQPSLHTQHRIGFRRARRVFAVGDGLRGCGAAAARGYDKVLVDAECTHDGSIKHLAKFATWGWESFERRFLCAERIANLRALQLELMAAGFRLLRPGGALVYSTCSFAVAQNEGVVGEFLSKEPSAELLPARGGALGGSPGRSGGLEGTLRFDPRTSRTSALFVARIGRAR